MQSFGYRPALSGAARSRRGSPVLAPGGQAADSRVSNHPVAAVLDDQEIKHYARWQPLLNLEGEEFRPVEAHQPFRRAHLQQPVPIRNKAKRRVAVSARPSLFALFFSYPNAYPIDAQWAERDGRRRQRAIENTRLHRITLASGAKGRPFESARACHIFNHLE
jgi:hypothetical protein